MRRDRGNWRDTTGEPSVTQRNLWGVATAGAWGARKHRPSTSARVAPPAEQRSIAGDLPYGLVAEQRALPRQQGDSARAAQASQTLNHRPPSIDVTRADDLTHECRHHITRVWTALVRVRRLPETIRGALGL